MARQTIPKGAALPAGSKLVRGTLDSSSNCASSQCAVEFGDGYIPPVQSQAPPLPVPEPMQPSAPVHNPMMPVPALDVPQMSQKVSDVQTGYFNKCDLGICGGADTAGQVAVMGDSTTGTIQAVPANAFWARQMFAVANNDTRSLAAQNHDWNTQAQDTLGHDQSFIDYANALRPVMGDAAYATARANMSAANGLGAGYSDSAFFTPDNAARHTMAGSLQAAGLAGNDTGMAEAAYMADPAAFNGAVLRVNPMTGETFMEAAGQISDGYNPANVNDVLAANYGGVGAYLGRVGMAEKGAADMRKVQAQGDARRDVANINSAGSINRAKIAGQFSLDRTALRNEGRAAEAATRAGAAAAGKSSALTTLEGKLAVLKAKAQADLVAAEVRHKQRLVEQQAAAAQRKGGAAPSSTPVLKAY